MGLTVDTSFLIAAERAKVDLDRLLDEADAEEIVSIASLTASELLHGLERTPPGHSFRRRKIFVEGLLRRLPCLPFGLEQARQHARIWAALEETGQRIGAHDLIIAATCLSHNHRLLTLNENEFKRVPGLQLEDSKPYIIDD